MCGLTGFWQPNDFNPESARATVQMMAESLHHRGPDDVGLWLDDRAGLALAHRRLSILDRSPAGHQPMQSPSGRWWIVFNGEIYNHLDLRRDLALQGKAPRWRGHSDTETLLAAVDAWGIEETLRRSVGMFAMALWNRQIRTLTLARDRMGEKPLYYGWQKGVLLFGSELKALRRHPSFIGEIDRGALALFFRHGVVPAPHSIVLGIHKLQPGTSLSITSDDMRASVAPPPHSYWSLSTVIDQGQRHSFQGSIQEAEDHLDSLLRQSVASQMLADVPVGAFLSGGVDSATVAAFCQSQSGSPVHTFTIGFHEKHYNEADHAAAVARFLGTDHSELYVTADQAMAVIPGLPEIYDEPFADSSQIPTFIVSQLARQQVTVGLSGDGGDELFGGYTRYALTSKLWHRLGLMPGCLRTGLARLLASCPAALWNQWFLIFERLFPRKYRYLNPGEKLHKLADVLMAATPDAAYLTLLSHWSDPSLLVLGAMQPSSAWIQNHDCLAALALQHRFMALDSIGYLPDDILVKVDRAAMAVSLETRAPFLDHRLVEFAWSLPLSFKIRDGQGKWILRRVLDRYVPRHLIDRPKMGFGVPIGQWLRGPLRDWAEDLLQERRMREAGYLDVRPVQRLWKDHLSGHGNHQYPLWNVLMWEAWRSHLNL